MKKNSSPHAFKGSDQESFYNSIIHPFDFITAVKAFIHRISFSLTISYDEICEIFDINFNLSKTGRYPRSASSIYLLEGWTDICGFKAHVMTGLSEDMRKVTNRFTMISIIPSGSISPKKHKKLISKIQNKLHHSDIVVSEIELAYDFMTDSSDKVPLILSALRKSLYLPYITKMEQIRIIGNQFIARNKLSTVVHYGQKNKLYERGKDEDKFSIRFRHLGDISKSPGWAKTNLDRVRLERTLERGELRNLEISDLNDLIEHRQFGMNIMHKIKDHYSFKEIIRGPYAFNYNCLISSSTKIGRKDVNILPIKRIAVRRLKRRMVNAAEKHSSIWFN